METFNKLIIKWINFPSKSTVLTMSENTKSLFITKFCTMYLFINFNFLIFFLILLYCVLKVNSWTLLYIWYWNEICPPPPPSPPHSLVVIVVWVGYASKKLLNSQRLWNIITVIKHKTCCWYFILFHVAVLLNFENNPRCYITT